VDKFAGEKIAVARIAEEVARESLPKLVWAVVGMTIVDIWKWRDFALHFL
jgi:hypothetical protein